MFGGYEGLRRGIRLELGFFHLEQNLGWVWRGKREFG